MSERIAFVTGGTGFVGINLIRELLDQGWKVTALHRESSDLRYWDGLDITRVLGSITDPASLAAGMPKGVDTVFHVAGNTNMWRGGEDRQYRENVVGSANMREAAVKAGARRIVATSSIAAYGAFTGEITEASPKLGAEGSCYMRTKYWGEMEIMKAIDMGVEAVAMNPAVVLGPYDTTSWAQMAIMIAKDKLPAVPPGFTSYTHVHEVAKAHVAAADKGEVGGNYLLGGTHGPYLDMVQEMARALGKRIPKKTTPAFALTAVAALGDFVSRFTGKEPVLAPATALMLNKHQTINSDKATAELGYQALPLKKMVQDTVDWLRAEGLV